MIVSVFILILLKEWKLTFSAYAGSVSPFLQSFASLEIQEFPYFAKRPIAMRVFSLLDKFGSSFTTANTSLTSSQDIASEDVGNKSNENSKRYFMR